MNDTVHSTLEGLGGNEEYSKVYFKIYSRGKPGLEQYSGVHNVEDYIYKYCCKPGEPFSNWGLICRYITNDYCSRVDHIYNSVRSLIWHHMNKVIDVLAITRD